MCRIKVRNLIDIYHARTNKRVQTTAVKKLSSQQKQPCTALKCAKCLQAGQSPDRKCCTTVSEQQVFQVNELMPKRFCYTAGVPV
jgi:hypothetical protein